MKKILSRLTTHSTTAIFFAVGVLFVSAFLFVPHIASAQGLPPSAYGLDPVEQAKNTQQLVNSAGTAAATTIGGFALDTVLGIVTAVAYLIFSIANYFLVLAGSVFNWSIVFLVFQFATTIGSSPGMLVAWSVLRDFANILLLFGFIFMGVVTILDLHAYPVQKTVPKFIIYAVLLNFSLLGVSAIIDGANVLAASLYNQTSGQSCAGLVGVTASQCQQKGLNVGIGGMIVESSRVGTVLSGGVNPFSLGSDGFLNAKDKMQYTIAMFGLAMFVTTLAVVLLAGAVLLISRAIVLAFLMVTSPIGVAGWAIDPLKDFAKDWWKKLIDNAIFAPVFLLLIFVSLKISEGVANRLGGTTATNNNLFDALTKGDVSLMGSIIVFALIIGFLVASLIAAKKFGVVFADAVYNQSMKTIGGVGSNIFAVPARSIIGGASNAGARLVRRSPLANIPVFGRALTGALDKGATSSFDVRGLGTPKEFGRASKAAQGGARGIAAANAKAVEDHIAGVSKERGKELGIIDTDISTLNDKEKELLLQIKSADERAKETGNPKDQKVAGDKKEDLKKLQAQRTALEEKKKKLLFTSMSKAQRENYDREHADAEKRERQIAAERANRQAEAASIAAERATTQTEADALARSLTEQDSDITALENLIATAEIERERNPETFTQEQRDKLAADKEQLLTRRGQVAKTRQQFAEKTTLIAQLETRAIENERVVGEKGVLDMAAKANAERIAAVRGEAVATYKNAPLREYTENLGPLAAVPVLGYDTKAAVAAIRSTKLKPASQIAMEHWIHELQHEMLHEAEHAAGAHKEEEHAPAPKKPSGGGGGGDHGGGGGGHH